MSERVTSSDYARPHRPRALAAANALMGLVGGPARADLEVAGLMEVASRRAGRDAFEDESFRPALEELVAAVEAEADLHPLGRWIFREQTIGQLVNRLRIEAVLAERPELREPHPDPPIVIAGLQRTGTTLLHRLLGVDPELRVLASWEALGPAPVPGKPEGGRAGRRRAGAFAERMLRYMAPDFVAIHPISADEPEEDVLLLGLAFMSTAPEATMAVPRFASWLEEQDHAPAYRYLSTVLRVLAAEQGPTRWLLKTPHHLEFLDSLIPAFPGVKIIQTHRDPTRTLASFCSMVAHGMGVFTDRVDASRVGAHWSRKVGRMVDRSMAVRDSELGRDRFVDVLYADLVRDPLAEVRRIYAFLERPLSDALVERMRSFLGANPKDKHGKHRYRLEDFGLTREREEHRFAAYKQRFGIPDEA